MFYVLNTYSDRSSVLSLDGYATEAAARQAVAWQERGDFGPNAICRFDDGLGAFVQLGPWDRPPVVFRPARGPYTAEAWEGFCRRVGYTEADPADVWAGVDALRAAEAFLSGFEDDRSQDMSALGKVRAALRQLTGEG